jgi:nitrate/nitrite transport system ATP-binding protein
VLIEIWNKEKITAVMITHDVDEAIFMSDRVVMMTSGPSAKIGDILPIEFERPRSRKKVLAHDDYYEYRKHLINFLEH